MCYRVVKRGFDIVFSAFLIILLSPLLILLALLFLAFSGWPIFFVQIRSGMKGKPFRMYKFRTMILHARTLQINGRKTENLITAIGKIIRPIHLDELLQLFNIIKGDMSFVGFRPKLIEQYEHLLNKDLDWKKIYSTRPGLTGLAPVLNYIDKKTSSKIFTKYHLASFDKMHHHEKSARVELFYVAHQSFLLDLKIIWWTFILEVEHLFGLFKS